MLDIAPDAVDDLIIDQEGISFVSYFGGNPEGHHLYFPLKSWVSVCAETGDGVLDMSHIEELSKTENQSDVEKAVASSRSKLRIVDDGE